MKSITWESILALVGGVTELALLVAGALKAAGCLIVGCPVEIPAEGEAMRSARERALARAQGADGQ